VRSAIPTIIIDPVMLFREGLSLLVSKAGFQPVWCSDQPPVALLPELLGDAAPLLIIGTQITSAFAQISEVKRLYPASRIVLLLDPLSHDQLVAALRCGADTLVLKRSSCEAFIGTLKLVLDGVTSLPSDLFDALLLIGETPRIAAPDDVPPDDVPPNGEPPEDVPDADAPSSRLGPQTFGLSVRELGVLDGVQDGLSNKEIARALKITEATVKVHVKAILRKARMRNRTQVAMWASRLGIGVPSHANGSS
jgi:two-component system nitrate/nitrite response regulator NarL